MKFIDFFSGIGGFRLGMEMAGHECVGHCEIDKFADKSYRAMHDVKESEWYANDIRGVNPGDLPYADCWCGGFPCQTFSIAGKRAGFEDMRGTLIFEIFRLAAERKPKILLLENVAGLLNHDEGRTLATILCGLWELGYHVQWQVLNSKDFGVPQNRERVFIEGYLGRNSGRKVFPIFGTNDKTIKQVSGGYQHQRVYDPNGLSVCLSSEGGGQGAKTGLYMFTDDGPGRTTRIKKDISSPLRAQGGGDKPGIYVYQKTHGATTTVKNDETGTLQAARLDKVPCVEVRAVLTPDREEKRQNGRRMKEPDEEMFTLTAQDKHGVLISGIYTNDSPNFHKGPLPGLSRTLKANKHDASVTDGARIRRLTPRECFRLQGFPDDYFDRAAKVNSDSQLYKQAGNSVTVNVIYEIAKRLGEGEK